jgi:Heparinase II/III-like protein/Heparinase II/III N-terminus
MKRFLLLFNTVKFLKPRQVYFRLYYTLRGRLRRVRGYSYPLSISSQSHPLKLKHSIVSLSSYDKNTFTFLNLFHTFDGGIDWNYSEYGKLWTYNLTYFDFLQQKGLNKEDGLNLIHLFIEQAGEIRDGLEPFPISLRGINWIKFLAQEKITEPKIDDFLFAQYLRLMDNLEYHLLGNHLLENGFSLLFGAYYFQDKKLYDKAKLILTAELEEQVLEDGAHFELSPMYHQIMLFRVLDCINLVQNNTFKEQELLPLLATKAKAMLGWLNTMTFANGCIPLFNDSANKIAPTTAQLNEYALVLQCFLHIKDASVCLPLNVSGYRKISKPQYEMIIDIGQIGPDYIPGHAHSDTFNFELYVASASGTSPFIVDTGLSTYETNARRTAERSTAAHNTVQLDGMEQSEVWGGFRVADRAVVVAVKENEDHIQAMHGGYKKRLEALHQREFVFSEYSIRIIDKVFSGQKHNAVARLHFHPDVRLEQAEDGIKADNWFVKINHPEFAVKSYQFAPEFNKLLPAQMLEISFTNKLEVEISCFPA